MVLKIVLLIILWIIFIGDFASNTLIVGGFISLLLIILGFRFESLKSIRFHSKK